MGQATRLATGVFDPGPLQYWLLAVPVHLDPVQGVLWGGALACMLASSLTIEAAWAVAGRTGGLLACAATLGAVAWIPQIAILPCWNPWFGLTFFFTALTAGWAVVSGRRGWWPVCVFTGSVAAQAHLMFAVAVALVVTLAFAAGTVSAVRARSGYRWAAVGAITGLACWAGPVYQQFTGATGNLGALISGNRALQQPSGLRFGFQALSGAAQPPAYWWLPIRGLGKLSVLQTRTYISGVVTLAVTVAVLAVAVCWLRSARLAALAAVSAATSVAVVVTYSQIPLASVATTTSQINNLRYLMAPLYPAGLLAWLTIGTAVLMIASRAVARARQRGPGSASRAAAARHTVWAARGRLWTAAALVVAAGALSTAETASLPGVHSSVMSVIGPATRQIRQTVPERQLVLSVAAPGTRLRRQLTFGLVYALRAAGYQPEISDFGTWAVQLGPQYLIHDTAIPRVTVYLSSTGGYRVKSGEPATTRR